MIARNLAALFAGVLLPVLLAVLLAAAPARADPDYPAFTGLVVDDAGVLAPADRATLTQKLEDLQQKSGVQFAVATVASLGGLEIEPYANALFRKWGIGQKGANNGLLLILAPNERKLRFEVGYGLEGTLTDAQSKLILRNDMVPKLKAGDPAGAVRAGVDDAIAVLTGKGAELPQTSTTQTWTTQGDGPSTWLFTLLALGIPFLVIAIFILAVVRALRSGNARWGTGNGGSSWNSTTSDNSSLGTDMPSSNSSDSFSGGGGGDSGGGGASDSY